MIELGAARTAPIRNKANTPRREAAKGDTANRKAKTADLKVAATKAHPPIAGMAL
jgi:hypothetical protein